MLNVINSYGPPVLPSHGGGYVGIPGTPLGPSGALRLVINLHEFPAESEVMIRL